MIALWAGLLLGLAGSGHCAGMCGPLVLVANPRSPDGAPAGGLALHVGLYHAGRVSMYVLLGLVAGLSGGLIASAGLGRWLAIAAGALLLASALRGTGLLGGAGGHGRVSRRVASALGRAGQWMRLHRLQGPLLFGAVNALLPCGLVYAAVTASAGFGNPADAVLFMSGFGAGTVPMLAAIALSGTRLAALLPTRIRRIAPVALAIAGLLLVARGINGPHLHRAAEAPGASAPAAAPAVDPHAQHAH